MYCKRCHYPASHPLGLTFNAEGICSGCLIHQEKLNLDWNARWGKLEKIVDLFRNQSGSNYDCVVPVSGARDSFFIMDVVVRKLGLNPLMVHYNRQYNTPLGIRNLGRLRTVFDQDLLTMTVNPETVKKITRATFRRFGSVYWHAIAGQTVFPVQIAVRFKIPLIIWGAHQGIEQVGMFSHEEEPEMSRWYRKNHDLMGYEAEDLVSDFDHLTMADLDAYRYPSEEELAKVGVRGIYLGNYIPWDVKSQHEKMLECYSYETSEQARTWDSYSDSDCFIYSDVHDYLKEIKTGYGKALDHAIRELRWGRISSDELEMIMGHYQNKKPEHLNLFLEWLGMSESGFYYLADRHRNPGIWSREKSTGIWKRKEEIFQKNPKVVSPHQCEFFIQKQEPIPGVEENQYQLIGTGNHHQPKKVGITLQKKKI